MTVKDFSTASGRKVEGARHGGLRRSRVVLVSVVLILLFSPLVSSAERRYSPPKDIPRAKPGDYLTDHEKDYFQGKISTWAYYASPLFIGGNPATENLRFWDRVDYELIFFPNMPHSTYAIVKDVFVDWWRQAGLTWYGQIYKKGVCELPSPRAFRNVLLGPFDGVVDGVHELYDALKIWDGHWKLPIHPGCTYEGGTRLLSWIVNKGIIAHTKRVKPVYYALLPIGGVFELAARGFNAGFLIGIKICKWPPMLLEGLTFGGYDLITCRERRGAFRNRRLPFSFKCGCIYYMYDGDMNYRRGPEKAPSKPPRKPKSPSARKRKWYWPF